MIYLDHCATTPIDPAVLEAMAAAAAEAWGNPASVHAAGRRARRELERARARVVECLGAPPPTAERPYPLVWTASGSEANNLAIQGSVWAWAPGPVHIIVSAIEHDCVLEAARALARRLDWVELTEIAPGPDGIVDPAAVDRAWRPHTRLVAVMLVNHETGAVQPVAEITRLAHTRGARMHTDAVQALGRMAVHVPALGCDSLALAAHKLYGPKGVGMLWVREGIDLAPIIHGGAHEGGMRAGTPDVPGAVGASVAVERLTASLDAHRAHLQRLEAHFLEGLRAEAIPFEINGPMADKVPGIVNLSVAGLHREDAVVGLDVEGIVISSGSACASGVARRSHVLEAMGLAPWRIEGGIRISFGNGNTLDEAQRAARALAAVARRARAARHARIEGGAS